MRARPSRGEARPPLACLFALNSHRVTVAHRGQAPSGPPQTFGSHTQAPREMGKGQSPVHPRFSPASREGATHERER
jgi:hypothetical protein